MIVPNKSTSLNPLTLALEPGEPDVTIQFTIGCDYTESQVVFTLKDDFLCNQPMSVGLSDFNTTMSQIHIRYLASKNITLVLKFTLIGESFTKTIEASYSTFESIPMSIVGTTVDFSNDYPDGKVKIGSVLNDYYDKEVRFIVVSDKLPYLTFYFEGKVLWGRIDRSLLFNGPEVQELLVINNINDLKSPLINVTLVYEESMANKKSEILILFFFGIFNLVIISMIIFLYKLTDQAEQNIDKTVDP